MQNKYWCKTNDTHQCLRFSLPKLPTCLRHIHTRAQSDAFTSLMPRMCSSTALQQRQAHLHTGSHLSPTATSPPVAMMCSLIGGADEVWWGQYLLNSLAYYMDNAGEEQPPSPFPFSSIHCPSRELPANPFLFIMAERTKGIWTRFPLASTHLTLPSVDFTS